MNRRKFSLSLGALLAGGAGAVGTGAFSSVTASRSIDVAVAGDANAYLAIEPTNGPNGAYAYGSQDGTMELDFTGSNPNVPGDGINTNALTVFEEVFKITNQGTQEVEVDIDPLILFEANVQSGLSLVAAVVIPSLGTTELGVGETQTYDIIAASYEADGEPDVGIDDQLTITAEET